MDIQINLSTSDINHSNSGKKRQIHTNNWRDKRAKGQKNKGLEYVGRNGQENDAKTVPDPNFECGPRCRNAGCTLPYERKLQLFQEFWNLGDHSAQSRILNGLIRRKNVAMRTVVQPETSRRQSSYDFYLSDANGVLFEVCKSLFLNTFSISEGRVSRILKKSAAGSISLPDLRGKAPNPRKVPDDVRQSIINFINGIPFQESHYSRNAGDPLRRYLAPELNIRKVYDRYVEVEGENAYPHRWLFEEVFREQNIRFGVPRSDTCDTCDELYNSICNLPENVQNEQQLTDLWMTLTDHHLTADGSYGILQSDCRTSLNNENLVVLCVDLQGVLNSPKLTNSSYYYQIKFKSYNFGIFRASDSHFTSCFWNQTEGNRGASEMFSCIYLYIHNNYEVLAQGQGRTLIVWSDRCSGQNNNYETLCGYQLLIDEGYFTEIVQKFLTTGHSFQPADRQFALIDKSLKNAIIHTPLDIVQCIENANHPQPFQIQRMSQENFLSFDVLKAEFRFPISLRITRCMVIKLTSLNRNVIQVKGCHTELDWISHNMVHAGNLLEILIPLKYLYPIPVPNNVRQDLLAMQKFLPTASLPFWNFLQDYRKSEILEGSSDLSKKPKQFAHSKIIKRAKMDLNDEDEEFKKKASFNTKLKKISAGLASKLSTQIQTLRSSNAISNLINKFSLFNQDEDLATITAANLPIIWIMGGPGAPIQALFERLAQVYTFHHVFVGEILRQELLIGTGQKDKVTNLMHRGVVLPRKYLNEIIKRDMADSIQTKETNGFIFTDFPNTYIQAKTFLKKIQKVDFIIMLKLDDKSMKLNTFHVLRRQSLCSRSLRKSKDELRQSAEERVNQYNKDMAMLYKLCGKKMKVVDGQLEIGAAYSEVMKWIERAMVIHNKIPPYLSEPPVNPRKLGSLTSEGGSIDLGSSSDNSL